MKRRKWISEMKSLTVLSGLMGQLVSDIVMNMASARHNIISGETSFCRMLPKPLIRRRLVKSRLSSK